MNVVAGPTSVYVSEPGNEGVTGTITLATSHASAHVWDHVRPSLIQFDIYSCKKFEVQTVIDHLNKFGIVDIVWIQLDRNENIKIIDSSNIDSSLHSTTHESTLEVSKI